MCGVLACIADDNLMDIFRFCHTLEWVLRLSRVCSLWRSLTFELIQKEFDKIQTNNRSNPILLNFEQVFSIDKGQLFLLRSIKRSFYQWSSAIIDKYGSLSSLKNVNDEWLKEEMTILYSYLNKRKFLKNLTKTGNIEEPNFLLVVENEENPYPFKNLRNSPTTTLSILGKTIPRPQITEKKQDSNYYYYSDRNSRIIGRGCLNNCSLIISLTDVSLIRNLKFLGRILNEIKDTTIYVKEKLNEVQIDRPVILVGFTSTETREIPSEQIERMAFNFNGSLYVEIKDAVGQQKEFDKLLLYGLLLIHFQKTYKIQFR